MLDIAELRRPTCYPDAPEDVEIVQTHISIVCIAGDRVYKLKKPVTLPFLDFSTPALREHFCREELRLNRRLCPWIYLDVVALRRAPSGGLNFRGDGEVVDHAVLMTRMPANRMLDVLLERNAVRGDEIDRLAATVADFHRRAERGPRVRAAGSPERLAHQIRANFVELRPYVGPVLDATLCRRLAVVAEADVTRLGPVLARRAEAGCVIEGHGDLHARNVCLTDPPAIFDCIEFSEEFRCSDVAAEIAFMAMDLRYRGHHELADRFVAAYAAASGDDALAGLMPPLVRHRAVVRAKVAAIAASDAEIAANDRAGAAASARRHLRLAAATSIEADGPLWIAACGPPASGKSVLLEALAHETGWPLLQSDRIRKALWGVAPAARLPPEAYAPPVTDDTYAEMLARGRTAGPVVLLDANWPTRDRRVQLAEAARAGGARLLVVHLDVSPDVARARLRRRAQDPGAVSDADAGVFERLAKTFEVPAADEGGVLVLDGAAPCAAQLDRVLGQLV